VGHKSINNHPLLLYPIDCSLMPAGKKRCHSVALQTILKIIVI
jgi:hypothetical protein